MNRPKPCMLNCNALWEDGPQNMNMNNDLEMDRRNERQAESHPDKILRQILKLASHKAGSKQ